MLKTGLYEQIIDQTLGAALEASKDEYIADTEKIDKDNYMKKLLEESEIKADLTANTLLKK